MCGSPTSSTDSGGGVMSSCVSLLLVAWATVLAIIGDTSMATSEVAACDSGMSVWCGSMTWSVFSSSHVAMFCVAWRAWYRAVRLSAFVRYDVG